MTSPKDAPEPQKIYRFDGFTLDPVARTLIGPGNAEVELRPLPFDALTLLLENGPNVVTKSDLMARLWPNSIVEENNLSQTISALRKALRDRAADTDFIITLPGRGFQFARPIDVVLRDDTPRDDPVFSAAPLVQPEEAAHPNPIPSSRWALALFTLVLIGVGLLVWSGSSVRSPTPETSSALRGKTIVILPLRAIAVDADNPYFADGLHDQLIANLSKSNDVNVIAETSAVSFEGQNLSPTEIGRKLGADFALEGSVRIEGDRVQVTSRLIDVDTEVYLWSESFARPIGEVFEIEAEIARLIASSMGESLTAGNSEAYADRSTRNSDAYLHYIKALSLYSDLNPRQPILDELEAAITLDPSFAEAISLKAFVHVMQATRPFVDSNPGDPDLKRRSLDAAQTLAERALELDDTLSYGHLTLSILHEQHFETEGGGLVWAERAHQLDPNNMRALVVLAHQLTFRGRIDDAIPLWEKALILDPQSWVAARSYAASLYRHKRFRRAREVLLHAIDLADNPGPQLSVCAYISALLNEEEAAIGFARQSMALLGQGAELALDEMFVQRNFLILTYQKLGLPEEAQSVFQDKSGLEKQVADDSWHVFQAQHGLGNINRALEILKGRLEEEPVSSRRYLQTMHDHPELASLRDHPEFLELAAAALQAP